MSRRNLVSGGSAGFLFTVPFGPRPALDNPENLGSQVMERLDGNHREVKGLLGKTDERLAALDDRAGKQDKRLDEIERKANRAGMFGGAGPEMKSWGQRFIEGDEYKGHQGTRDRQGLRFRAEVASTTVEHKNITSAANSGAPFIPTDRRPQDAALLPWNTLTVRDLVAPGVTSSNAVSYPRMTARTNNAAMVAEGDLKPKSDMTFEEVTAPVRTLAHYFLASRQSLDDAPALASIIDAEGRSGLADVEDGQLLFGDGTGQSLFGLVPQATAFAKQWVDGAGGPLSVVIQAIAQVEGSNFTADGIVMNSVDWRWIQSLRDTIGQYLGSNPFQAAVLRQLWELPVATTNKMPRGKFLVGPFRTQAQIFDRMGVEVLASSEDSDNFRRNLITIRVEERLAFTVRRPSSFVYGDLSTSLAA